MQVTTYGVTPKKVEVYNADVIKDFLSKEKEKIKFLDKKSCLYPNKFIIKDPVLNYLNENPTTEVTRTIKNLLLNEYYKCENIYPYLGDLFLYRYFDQVKPIKKKFSFRYRKDNQNKFVESIEDESVQGIIKWIVNNVSLERNISIETHNGKDVLIDSIDDFVFSFEYDTDFYKNNFGMKVKNYRFIIIDGYIESVGEIHHALHKSNETKEPYVIFCHGLSDDVKYNIIKNNAEGRTQFLPVSINFNESTLNVLSDLAAVHNSTVVSSKLGQTISQEMRKELEVGNAITFFQDKILIKTCASDLVINTHRRFLEKRINEASVDTSTDVLVDRLKNFSSKTLKIYIPESIYEKKFSRELDYSLRFLSNLDKFMIEKNVKFKKNYFIPTVYNDLVERKVKNLKNIIDNITRILA